MIYLVAPISPVKPTRVSDVRPVHRHVPGRAGTERRPVGAAGHDDTQNHGGRGSGSAPQGPAGNTDTGSEPAKRRWPAPAGAHRDGTDDAVAHASGLDAGGPGG